MTQYDSKAIYKEEVAPLVEEIHMKCLQHSIPFFFAASVANSEKGTEYERDIVSPKTLGIDLTQNYYIQLLLASNGMKCELHALSRIAKMRCYDDVNHPIDFEEDDFPDLDADDVVDFDEEDVDSSDEYGDED